MLSRRVGAAVWFSLAAGLAGGAVRGEGTRWFLFPDATVEVNGTLLVRDGVLQTF